jgi:hypothetical protein
MVGFALGCRKGDESPALRGDGLGIGLFIVRQAIGMLRHRVDVSSIACRGSRFSIFAARAEKKVDVASHGKVIQGMENSERHHEIRVGEIQSTSRGSLP